MKQINLCLFIILLGVNVQAQTYHLDLEQSQLRWTGKAAFNAYSLSGTLRAKEGFIGVRGGTISQAEVLVNMTSLEAANKDLERHLRSEDFFEVDRFPIAEFELTMPFDPEKSNAVRGNLMIKENTRPQVIALTLERKETEWIIQGKMAIDRTQYGIVFNSPNFFENLKDQAIADQIELEFFLVFVPPSAN